MGIIISQPAVKGIKHYCCKSVTLNLGYANIKQLIGSLTPWFSSALNIRFNVHTNSVESWQHFTALLSEISAVFIMNDISNTNTTVKKYNMGWGGIRNRGTSELRNKIRLNPLVVPCEGIFNTHLKFHCTKVELNTDLGFSWSNRGERALFKRDHSKKDCKDPYREPISVENTDDKP